MAEQYCLKWNNHQSTLLVQFETLLESDTLTDCTLSADGKYLNVHKVLLSACSPYFSKLLGEHKDKHPIFFMKDVAYDELKGIVEYMYKGEVNVTQERLDSFLKTASSLQIKGLADSDGKGSDDGSDTGGGGNRSKRKTAPDWRGGSGYDSAPAPEEQSPRSPKRRRRPRPVSQEDSPLPPADQNHCDTSSTFAGQISQPPPADIVMPTPMLPVRKTEPLDNSTVHLKTELPDDAPQVDVQDLTLDDDEEFNEDVTTQPGTSFSESSQDFKWFQQQMAANQQGGTMDEQFLSSTPAQQNVNQSPGTQDSHAVNNGCGSLDSNNEQDEDGNQNDIHKDEESQNHSEAPRAITILEKGMNSNNWDEHTYHIMYLESCSEEESIESCDEYFDKSIVSMDERDTTNVESPTKIGLSIDQNEVSQDMAGRTNVSKEETHVKSLDNVDHINNISPSDKRCDGFTKTKKSSSSIESLLIKRYSLSANELHLPTGPKVNNLPSNFTNSTDKDNSQPEVLDRSCITVNSIIQHAEPESSFVKECAVLLKEIQPKSKPQAKVQKGLKRSLNGPKAKALKVSGGDRVIPAGKRLKLCSAKKGLPAKGLSSGSSVKGHRGMRIKPLKGDHHRSLPAAMCPRNPLTDLRTLESSTNDGTFPKSHVESGKARGKRNTTREISNSQGTKHHRNSTNETNMESDSDHFEENSSPTRDAGKQLALVRRRSDSSVLRRITRSENYDNEQLQEHRANSRFSSVFSFVCICGGSFLTLRKLTMHRERFCGMQNYICVLCNWKTKYFYVFSKHLATAHFEYISKMILVKNNLESNNSKLLCPCGHEASDRRSLSCHKKDCNKEFNCLHCDFASKVLSDVVNHLAFHHVKLYSQTDLPLSTEQLSKRSFTNNDSS